MMSPAKAREALDHFSIVHHRSQQLLEEFRRWALRDRSIVHDSPRPGILGSERTERHEARSSHGTGIGRTPDRTPLVEDLLEAHRVTTLITRRQEVPATSSS
jgi:hypothetical protein